MDGLEKYYPNDTFIVEKNRTEVISSILTLYSEEIISNYKSLKKNSVTNNRTY